MSPYRGWGLIIICKLINLTPTNHCSDFIFTDIAFIFLLGLFYLFLHTIIFINNPIIMTGTPMMQTVKKNPERILLVFIDTIRAFLFSGQLSYQHMAAEKVT
jgi:hypothetical protein